MSLWHELGVRAQPHFSWGTGMVDLTDLPNACPLDFPRIDRSISFATCNDSDDQRSTNERNVQESEEQSKEFYPYPFSVKIIHTAH
jgi:hypothetical protein